MGRFAAILALVGLAVGCGPSLRRVQQSSVYFERCYAADFDARIPLGEKHACWSAWLEHYTNGQPEERTHYARERVYAIEHGESVPRLPGLPEAMVGPTRSAPVTVSSEALVAEEPAPPAQAEREDPPEARSERRPAPLPRTGNPTCAAQACEPAWRSCVDGCDDRPGCETACEVELQACARGCF